MAQAEPNDSETDSAQIKNPRLSEDGRGFSLCVEKELHFEAGHYLLKFFRLIVQHFGGLQRFL